MNRTLGTIPFVCDPDGADLKHARRAGCDPYNSCDALVLANEVHAKVGAGVEDARARERILEILLGSSVLEMQS